MLKSKTSKLSLCALFAALTAILSQVVIPIGPVPINLATFAVFCAGAILGSKLSALSLAVWAALGVFGTPVFTMFRSGLATLGGPTGGYIIGYIPAAFCTGFILEKFNKNDRIYLYFIAMMFGSFLYFAMGTLWFMFSTNTGLRQALIICVIPFIPGDLAKIAVATLLSKRMRTILDSSMRSR